jgi:hypothetical protein
MEQAKALLASWARSFIAGALAVYLATGETDFKKLGYAGFAALAPVLLRWLNPNDQAFGISKA